MRLLLVEDDIPLGSALKQSFHDEGYAVDWVESGQHAILAFPDSDLAVLDLGLPDMDGLQVLKEIRGKDANKPVLILTARDGIESKVSGLDLGADDYLSKPFEMEELLARVRVLGRRINSMSSNVILIGGVELNLHDHKVTVESETLSLSRREYMIMKALMENAGRILSKAQLETKLYDWGEEVTSNTIEVHIHNIRKKLPIGFINTVRGVGYIVRPS